jgi:hypothetical protein
VVCARNLDNLILSNSFSWFYPGVVREDIENAKLPPFGLYRVIDSISTNLCGDPKARTFLCNIYFPALSEKILVRAAS